MTSASNLGSLDFFSVLEFEQISFVSKHKMDPLRFCIPTFHEIFKRSAKVLMLFVTESLYECLADLAFLDPRIILMFEEISSERELDAIFVQMDTI